jgi:hypothetical protein
MGKSYLRIYRSRHDPHSLSTLQFLNLHMPPIGKLMNGGHCTSMDAREQVLSYRHVETSIEGILSCCPLAQLCTQYQCTPEAPRSILPYLIHIKKVHRVDRGKSCPHRRTRQKSGLCSGTNEP